MQGVYFRGFCFRSLAGEVGACEDSAASLAPAAPGACCCFMRCSLLSMSCMKRAHASTFSQSEAGRALSL